MMREIEKFYKGVPTQQKKSLAQFRAWHPYKNLHFRGSNWRYISCGTGKKTLLLLPGGFMRADMWFYVIHQLESSYRIIAPDAHSLHNVFEMEDVCDALEQMLDKEDVEKATVVGVSAGGGIAQCFVQMLPERVEHLILSHSSTVESLAEVKEKMRAIMTLIKIQPLFVVRQLMLKKMAVNAPKSSSWGEFAQSYIKEVLSLIDKKILLQSLEAGLHSADQFVFSQERAEDWEGRVLLLSSKDDALSFHRLKFLQERYPNAELHVFEEGGHHTQLLFPERYSHVLRQFLEQALV